MVLASEQSEGEGLPCPRCDSRETKFCYFNNYSTTQPRHFCRNCKRYWTAGGSLRNVPVGGGLRKTKKSKLSKHGRDLLSAASTEDSLSPGNGILALRGGASPSSSVDGLTDETSAKFVMPLCAYRPTLDSEAGASIAAGDRYPYTAPRFEYHHTENFTHFNGADPTGHEQHIHDANQGFFHLRFAAGSVDQAQSSSGEISSEPSQAADQEATVLPAMHCPRNATPYRLNDRGQQANVTPHRPRHDQSNSQCSVEKLASPHHRSSRSSLIEVDEELGNVINVRHPYDWEQVSEVVFGGRTPDFFNLSTF